jgi:hypothetical protein
MSHNSFSQSQSDQLYSRVPRPYGPSQDAKPPYKPSARIRLGCEAMHSIVRFSILFQIIAIIAIDVVIYNKSKGGGPIPVPPGTPLNDPAYLTMWISAPLISLALVWFIGMLYFVHRSQKGGRPYPFLGIAIGELVLALISAAFFITGVVNIVKKSQQPRYGKPDLPWDALIASFVGLLM